MSIRTRARTGTTRLDTFDESRLVSGDEESRREAREELARMRRLHAAESSNLPRLDRDTLDFQPFGVVVHRLTGTRYKVSHGDYPDGVLSNAHGWYLDADHGEPRYLERMR